MERPMSPDEMIKIVNVHRYAEDTNDLDTAMSTYHDDCFYQVVTEGLRIEGKQNVRRMYEATMRNVPSRPREVDGTAVGDNCVVQWAHETVTIPKQLFGLAEDLHVELHGVTIVPFKEGKMQAEIIYTNAMDAFLKAGLTIEQIKSLHSAGG
jgi:hypothetical protein